MFNSIIKFWCMYQFSVAYWIDEKHGKVLDQGKKRPGVGARENMAWCWIDNKNSPVLDWWKIWPGIGGVKKFR